MSDGWEAMADIGRLGLETAAGVVERILDLSRRAADAGIPTLSPNGEGDPARRLRADAERLIDLYADWTRTLVDGALAGVRPTEVLVLGPVAPGAKTDGAAWLHVTAGAVGDAQIRSTDLTGHDGSVIPAAALSCTPPVLDTATPSQQLTVVADVPAPTPPGHYHGHLLVAGLPEVVLAVRVEVAVDVRAGDDEAGAHAHG